MNNNLIKKFASICATLSLLVNSLVAPIAVYSQEDSPTPEATPIEEITPTASETPRPEADQPLAETSEVIPTPTEEVSPTPEPTVTPSEELTPEPTQESTPTSTDEPIITDTPEVTPEEQKVTEVSEETGPVTTVTSVISETEESRPEADQPVAETQEPTPSEQNPQGETPIIIPAEPEKGNLSAVILNDNLASSISDFSEFDFGYKEAGSASLVTDKSDYAPTETVLIYGTEFAPNRQYTLEITSETGNFKFSDTVTSDESGSLFYSFQLDGTYRPLYKVEAKAGEIIIASTTFTDSHEDYKHWADKLPSPNWQNGALQSSNSQYSEGEVVPHYWITEGLTVNSTYGFNIYYDYYWTSGSYCGFDYLAQYNTSRSPSSIGSSPSSDDAFSEGYGNFYTVGADILTVSSPIATGKQRYVQVKFKANATSAEFYWGLHLAVPGAISSCQGAHSWPGASLQTNVDDSPSISGTSMRGGGGTMQINPKAIAPVPQNGSITLDKVTNPSGDAETFSFSTTGLPSPTSPSLTDTSTPITWSNLSVGTYTITETLVSGWSLDSKNCTGGTSSVVTQITNGVSISLAVGENLTCTFSNSKQPKLSVAKVVINDNGGTKVVNNFPLFVDGNPVTSGIQNTFNIGAHVVSETGDSAYSATINGDCDSQGNITLNPGDIKSCTITNDDQPATLTVVKQVINDNGGTKSPSDFAITVTGNSPSPSNFAGNEAGTTVTLNAGSYSVDETSDPGYDKNLSIECSGSIAVGQSKRCFITNDDIQPKLTVTKLVTNDNGGTLGISSFPLFVDQTPVASGVENGFNAGTYTVSETQQPGYSALISDDCAADGLITLNVGDIKSCTITNNDIQPTLKVVKVLVNDNGGTAQISDFPLKVDNTSVNSDEVNSFDADTYQVSESNQTGYSSTFSGDCDRNGNVTLAVGDMLKTCTITNDDIQPRLTVNKVVVNDNGGGKQVSDFPLFVDQTSVTSGVQNGFNAGTYSVSETPQTGYTAVFSDDCASDGSITLALGDVKTCTITNDDQPASIGGKKFNDGNGDGVFGNEPGLPDWHIQLFQDNSGQIGRQVGADAVTDSNGDYLFDNISAGHYFVCEVQQSGWVQTYPSGCHQITVLPGDKWTLNFGNQEVKLGLILGKSNDKASGASAGDTVTYGLNLTNTSNQEIHNLQIIDVLPGGFSYVSGSTVINGNAAADPTISAGVLTWDIGTLAIDGTVTVSYQAKILSDTTAGDYKNLATCRANGYSSLRQVLLDSVECDPFASSVVTIGKSTDFSGSVAAAVLGATTVLPATGGNLQFLLLAIIGLSLGITLKLGGFLLKNKYGKN